MIIRSAVSKELRLLSRDLHGLAVLFVMPILFMFIMSLALSRDDDPHVDARIAVVGFAGDGLNQSFAQALAAKKMDVDQDVPAHLAALKQQLRQGRYQMLVHNPNRLTNRLEEDQPLRLYVNPNVDRSWLLGMKGVLQEQYTRQRLDYFFEQQTSATTAAASSVQAARIQQNIRDEQKKTFADIQHYLAQPAMTEVYLSQQDTVVERPNSVQHSVPAWLIFGMFFIMIPLSNVMAMERQTNTLTRLRLAQASAGWLLLSKLLPYFLINQLQFIGMIALGRYVLPLFDVPAFTLEGPYWQYGLLSCAVSVSALGYGLLVSVLAKSTEHAVVLGGGGIILMAAIGGIMVPSHVMPQAMQAMTQISPMSWALKGFHDLLLNRYSFPQILHHVYLLLLFGLACLSMATLLYARQLKTQVRF